MAMQPPFLGMPPGDLCLVAAHAWDVHGAKAAGLKTGLRLAPVQPFPATMLRPGRDRATNWPIRQRPSAHFRVEGSGLHVR